MKIHGTLTHLGHGIDVSRATPTFIVHLWGGDGLVLNVVKLSRKDNSHDEAIDGNDLAKNNTILRSQQVMSAKE